MTDAVVGTNVSFTDEYWTAEILSFAAMVQLGTAQLKPAAAMTESGDLRQIMNLRWESQFPDNDQFIQKVDCHPALSCYWAKII